MGEVGGREGKDKARQALLERGHHCAIPHGIWHLWGVEGAQLNGSRPLGRGAGASRMSCA